MIIVLKKSEAFSFELGVSVNGRKPIADVTLHYKGAVFFEFNTLRLLYEEKKEEL